MWLQGVGGGVGMGGGEVCRGASTVVLIREVPGVSASVQTKALERPPRFPLLTCHAVMLSFFPPMTLILLPPLSPT